MHAIYGERIADHFFCSVIEYNHFFNIVFVAFFFLSNLGFLHAISMIVWGDPLSF